MASKKRGSKSSKSSAKSSSKKRVTKKPSAAPPRKASKGSAKKRAAKKAGAAAKAIVKRGAKALGAAATTAKVLTAEVASMAMSCDVCVLTILREESGREPLPTRKLSALFTPCNLAVINQLKSRFRNECRGPAGMRFNCSSTVAEVVAEVCGG